MLLQIKESDDGVIIAERFCLRKCVCFCSQFSVSWKTFFFFCQTVKRISLKNWKIWKGNC